MGHEFSSQQHNPNSIADKINYAKATMDARFNELRPSANREVVEAVLSARDAAAAVAGGLNEGYAAAKGPDDVVFSSHSSKGYNLSPFDAAAAQAEADIANFNSTGAYVEARRKPDGEEALTAINAMTGMNEERRRNATLVQGMTENRGHSQVQHNTYAVETDMPDVYGLITESKIYGPANPNNPNHIPELLNGPDSNQVTLSFASREYVTSLQQRVQQEAAMANERQADYGLAA